MLLSLDEIHKRINGINDKFGKNYKFELPEVYTGIHMKIMAECEFGHKFMISIDNAYRGKGCPKCSVVNVAESHRLSSEQALSNLIKVWGDTYEFLDIHNYRSAHEKLAVRCKVGDHGIFYASYANLNSGKGCSKCKIEILTQSRRNVKNKSGLANYNSYHSKVSIDDNPMCGSDGELLVKCKLCGKMFAPLLQAVFSRIKALNTIGFGECSFYCSNDCKYNCDVYRKRTDISILAQQINNYEAKVKLARNCQLQSKSTLRQIQIDMCGYTFCEKCGKGVDNPELHHTIEVAKDPAGSITPAGHMLVCEDCHKEFTVKCK